MITTYDVYCAYRKANSLVNNKPYRLPKDWEAYKEKMNSANRKWLEVTTMYFNTTWSNVDLETYMKCGFEVYKDFTYKHFTNSQVLSHYIHKDKVKKRKMNSEIQEIEDTFDYIKGFMVDVPRRAGYSQLQNFCKLRDGERRVIINMYMRGQIDTMTLVYCLSKRYLIMSDDERALVPYISQRYRELLDNLHSVKNVIAQKEAELDVN